METLARRLRLHVVFRHVANSEGRWTGVLTISGLLYIGYVADGAGGPIGKGCCMPRLYDLLRAGKFVNDQRAGVAAEPSRNPSSNRLGQPSSVCLEFRLASGSTNNYLTGGTNLLSVSRRAKRLPHRLHRWLRALRCTLSLCLSRSVFLWNFLVQGALPTTAVQG